MECEITDHLTGGGMVGKEEAVNKKNARHLR
jgi:hypothetical protein